MPLLALECHTRLTLTISDTHHRFTRVGIESVHDFHALLGRLRAGNHLVADSRFVQMQSDNVQHSGPLADNHRFVVRIVDTEMRQRKA